MAYITLAEAKQYLGDIYESAYINITTDLVDETILQDDIDGVTGVIDSYVKRVYDQVLTGAQTLVMMRSISEQLLFAKAYERFDSSEVPDWVKDRYDRAIFRLKDIHCNPKVGGHFNPNLNFICHHPNSKRRDTSTISSIIFVGP